VSDGFFLDPETMASLEWEAFLGSVKTHSSLGRMRKEKLKPFLPGQEKELKSELRRTAKMASYLEEEPAWGTRLGALLGEVKDVRRSLERAREGLVLTTAELFEVKRLLLVSNQIRALLGEKTLPFIAAMRPQGSRRLFQLLRKGGQSPQSFSLCAAYSHRLAALRNRRNRLQRELEREKAEAESWLRPGGLHFNSHETVTTPRGDPKTDRLRACKLLSLVGETALEATFRLQRSLQSMAWQEDIRRLRREEEQEEKAVRATLSKKIGAQAEALRRDLDRIAALDFLLAKAELACRYQGTRPAPLPKESPTVLKMEDGVHWPLAQRLAEKGIPFQPLSIDLGLGAALVTGANMSGKTVLLKTVGLLVAMGQHGFLIPATRFSWIPRDFLFFSTRRRDQDGLSAFGAEVAGVQRMLRERTRAGLLLIDELARGTNPQEGFAINAALLCYLRGMASAALFTSHFEGLANTTGAVHWQMVGLGDIRMEEVRALLREGGDAVLLRLMCYKLQKVTAKHLFPRDALKIALLLGLEDEVIKLAEQFTEGTSLWLPGQTIDEARKKDAGRALPWAGSVPDVAPRSAAKRSRTRAGLRLNRENLP
jgi:DNA mismatch repair protein MutS2